MGLAIFYDPCLRCEHKETHKMCNMCLLTYLQNTHDSVKPVTEETPKQINSELYKSMNWEEETDD